MPTLMECRLNDDGLDTQPDSLLGELETTALDPTRWVDMDGLLRALTRSVLDATATMRFESLEPYELALAFAARQISGSLSDESPFDDPRYILGRLDGLLDACDLAIDQSISNKVLELARGRSHAYPILDHLRKNGETRASDLADAIGVERNHLSNELRWMETAGLVRRAAVGRASLVSLGPKAHAVYAAMRAEQGDGNQAGASDDYCAPIEDRSHVHEPIGAIKEPVAI